ncbi:hypothetical protein DSL72_002687 [Monilinia vaccinii-corymbosi]|uniref:Uncharacterized protein n=1 Tax=Monilinia vaccinii-corymbosi TaxID=61207 RepID=A0A8A3PD54_9HELO|nr:hypothetical protein DSL72_002687 [Monilinia vaccinii-corymbosi]
MHPFVVLQVLLGSPSWQSGVELGSEVEGQLLVDAGAKAKTLNKLRLFPICAVFSLAHTTSPSIAANREALGIGLFTKGQARIVLLTCVESLKRDSLGAHSGSTSSNDNGLACSITVQDEGQFLQGYTADHFPIQHIAEFYFCFDSHQQAGIAKGMSAD